MADHHHHVRVERVPLGGGPPASPSCVCGVVTIDRPVARNALTLAMIKAIAGAFRDFGEDPAVRVVIVTGSPSSGAFSAGVDLTAASKVFKRSEEDLEHDVVHQMERCGVPIIGLVDGPAVTAGFEIALGCDILLATSRAYFMDTHCKFGIMPGGSPRAHPFSLSLSVSVSLSLFVRPSVADSLPLSLPLFFRPRSRWPAAGWGLSQKLARWVSPNRARLAAFASDRIDAKRALDWGLVTSLHATAEDLASAGMSLARRIAAQDDRTVREYKRVLAEGYGMTYREGRELERKVAWRAYAEMDPNHFDKLKAFKSKL